MEYKISRLQDASRGEELAKLSLQVRQWEEEKGLHKYVDINSSQAEFKNLGDYYFSLKGGVWVAEDMNRNIIGVVGFKPLNAQTGELRRLAVSPESQREGIGTSLVNEVVQLAGSEGYESITLRTGSKQKGMNIALRAGFEEEFREDDSVGNTLIYMKKRLVNFV